MISRSRRHEARCISAGKMRNGENCSLREQKKRQKLLSRRANTSYLCFRTIIQLIYSMEKLQQHFAKLLRETDTRFHRYLYGQINWANRMVGLTGPRGVGKTTLVLQHIKENLPRDTSLYVTAEDFYFSTHRLADLADDFEKMAARTCSSTKSTNTPTGPKS